MCLKLGSNNNNTGAEMVLKSISRSNSIYDNAMHNVMVDWECKQRSGNVVVEQWSNDEIERHLRRIGVNED